MRLEPTGRVDVLWGTLPRRVASALVILVIIPAVLRATTCGNGLALSCSQMTRLICLDLAASPPVGAKVGIDRSPSAFCMSIMQP